MNRFIVAGVAVIFGASTGGPMGISTGAAGVVAGVAIGGLGMLIAAVGEMLSAVVDTAANTRVSADRLAVLVGTPAAETDDSIQDEDSED